MKLTQTRSSAGFYRSSALLLAAAILVGCSTPPKTIDGVVYAPNDAKATSLVIVREDPASVALTYKPQAPKPAAEAPAPAPAATEAATATATTAADTTSAPTTEAATGPVEEPAPPISPLNVDRKLTVDLNTGATVFIDSDGKTYTISLSKTELDAVRGLAGGKAWRVGTVWDKSVTPGTEALFTATAYAIDAKAKKPETLPIYEHVQWLRPSAKPLPDAVKQLQDFYISHERAYHPLSEEIDLLN